MENYVKTNRGNNNKSPKLGHKDNKNQNNNKDVTASIWGRWIVDILLVCAHVPTL